MLAPRAPTCLLSHCLRWPSCCPCLFLLEFQKEWGRQTAHILKGEIISLLPVLGKIIYSQKCLLVTSFVERHFGTTGWKNQNAFHKMICLQYSFLRSHKDYL